MKKVMVVVMSVAVAATAVMSLLVAVAISATPAPTVWFGGVSPQYVEQLVGQLENAQTLKWVWGVIGLLLGVAIGRITAVRAAVSAAQRAWNEACR